MLTRSSWSPLYRICSIKKRSAISGEASSKPATQKNHARGLYDAVHADVWPPAVVNGQLTRRDQSPGGGGP
jgi:hypothetical protein